MRSLFGRGGAVAVTVSPAQLRPGDELTATIAVPSAIEKVAAAKAELGYLNTYAYRWAGRADAAATAGADSLATIGQVGTDYGSERETTDWVGVVASAAGDHGRRARRRHPRPAVPRAVVGARLLGGNS